MKDIVRSHFKIILSWLLAMIVSVMILNLLIVPFYHFAPWIDLPCNATTGVFAPNSTIIYGLEGFSIRKVDSNGYVNPQERIGQEEYILVMGSSHSVGKEVPYGKNYADLLEKDGGYNVYNVAMDGNYFVEIMQGFEAALEQFNNVKGIVIEIGRVSFSKEELEQAKKVREYNPEYAGENILNNLSLADGIKLYVQNYLPIVRQIQRNVRATDSLNVNSEPSKTNLDIESYINSLDNILGDKRRAFDGDIVIVYRPGVSINTDGSIEILEEANVREFESICDKNDIEFINLNDEFIELYNNDNRLPYGFCNTVIGKGHLNQYGHRIVAEQLIEYFDSKK